MATRPPISAEKLAELDAKYGADKIAHVKAKRTRTEGEGEATVTLPIWECVFRKPTRAEWKAYKRAVHDKAELPDAQENLARKCAVEPHHQEFDALLEDWPAIPEAAVKAFDVLLGMEIEASGNG